MLTSFTLLSAGSLNTFLCCKFLVIFSRISYAVYLTQFAVFFYNVGSIRASEQFSLLRSVSFVNDDDDVFLLL
jgi:hypothetical protein